jgi:Calcineurin-like phosphoesterase/Purple acid Phosphatase, N-terminal domain
MPISKSTNTRSHLSNISATALMVMSAALGLVAVPSTSAQAHAGHTPVATPQWQNASAWPDRVVATFEADPTTSFAVSWRTDATVPASVAEIARATPSGGFAHASTSKPATTEPLDLETVRSAGAELKMEWNAGLSPVHYHSVSFEGLEPDTLYAYRVRGADNKWSEWFQIRTAPIAGTPFRFIYMGDAQNGILSHWSRTVRASFQKAPDARFILHAGDLVNRGSRDIEWAEWFKAVGFIHGMIPAIPVAGNHEYDSLGTAPNVQRLLSAMWRPQFRLPSVASLPAELRETVYKIAYNGDLDVFVLDSTPANRSGDGVAVAQAQAAWLDAELARSTTRWKVVTMHHPIFSSGEGRDSKPWRDAILPVLTKHKVDLVLQGHDHTYARGTIGESGPQRPERSADGAGAVVTTMFVNSVSGPKMYKFKNDRWDQYAPSGVRLDRFAEGAQFFQVIEINGDALDYRAYAATGDLYDSFVLRKDGAGTKRIAAGPVATVPQQTFSPANPYKDFRD